MGHQGQLDTAVTVGIEDAELVSGPVESGAERNTLPTGSDPVAIQKTVFPQEVLGLSLGGLRPDTVLQTVVLDPARWIEQADMTGIERVRSFVEIRAVKYIMHQVLVIGEGAAPGNATRVHKDGVIRGGADVARPLGVPFPAGERLLVDGRG